MLFRLPQFSKENVIVRALSGQNLYPQNKFLATPLKTTVLLSDWKLCTHQPNANRGYSGNGCMLDLHYNNYNKF